MRSRTFLLPGLLLLLTLTLGCGGSSSSVATPAPPAAVPAQGLAYADPVGTGWRLIKDPTSTPKRLLLNLVGPSGLKSRGVAFNVLAPASVRFGKFQTGDRVTNDLPIKDTGAYFLLNTDPRDPLSGESISSDPLEPKLLAGGVKKGNLLTAGIFQKDRREPAKDSGRALCQIALEFDAAANLSAGDKLLLSIPKSKYMAEDIGAFSVHPTFEMEAKAHLVAIQVAVGALTAQ